MKYKNHPEIFGKIILGEKGISSTWKKLQKKSIRKKPWKSENDTVIHGYFPYFWWVSSLFSLSYVILIFFIQFHANMRHLQLFFAHFFVKNWRFLLVLAWKTGNILAYCSSRRGGGNLELFAKIFTLGDYIHAKSWSFTKFCNIYREKCQFLVDFMV